MGFPQFYSDSGSLCPKTAISSDAVENDTLKLQDINIKGEMHNFHCHEISHQHLRPKTNVHLVSSVKGEGNKNSGQTVKLDSADQT